MPFRHNPAEKKDRSLSDYGATNDVPWTDSHEGWDVPRTGWLVADGRRHDPCCRQVRRLIVGLHSGELQSRGAGNIGPEAWMRSMMAPAHGIVRVKACREINQGEHTPTTSGNGHG